MKCLQIPFLALLLALAGCEEPMTRQQVIEAVRICEAAGMKAELVRQDQLDGLQIIVDVQCVPK